MKPPISYLAFMLRNNSRAWIIADARNGYLKCLYLRMRSGFIHDETLSIIHDVQVEMDEGRNLPFQLFFLTEKKKKNLKGPI